MLTDVPNSVFSAFSFIGFVLVLIPFYWHLEAWNTGTCLYMGWTAIQCLNLFINSVVWNNNAINWAPVWCDISSRIYIGSSVAILAASLCINRRLYHISKVEAVVVTRQEKRRGVMIDLAIGLGIPFLQMILSYIVQGHRFDIFEDIGCEPFIYNTWPAYPLSKVWPLAIAMVSAVYSALSIRQFVKRKTEFSKFLSPHTNLTSSRYFRLMALAGVEVLCGIPLSIYTIYLNVTSFPVQPWISWEDTHFNFSKVDQVPAVIWRSNPVLQASLESSRWFTVICAFIFFAFFGFADEALKHYRRLYVFVAKCLGYESVSESKAPGSSVWKTKPGPVNVRGPLNITLPLHLNTHRRPQRDSDLSFSDRLDSVIILGDIDSFMDGHESKTDRPFSGQRAVMPSSAEPHPSEALELQWPDDHFIHVSSVPRHDLDAPLSVRPSPHISTIDIV
ncbi:STE3-domain-containing protein [Gloeophyllum trabeum ATCC 11539]|uniref:STE3-domain-containing protein n=1 Tax=Gloeophyllum trabeum (strain ATCC 11539 / FP-39264 / Madison 617) TaxID=670483 RepID=S7Q825_GLOTA|nr:STE3-domain-containing protein [Gloeophyllum trabeum ATCC 11539]EPQ55598.1 STE3-domain-containing protein [Gloeophyllum trabeum ATCC 11539]